MVSAVGSQHRHVQVVPPKAQNPEIPQAAGKSMESVGHGAKAEIFADAETAPNAQGKAAAMLAKLDLSAITPQPPVDGVEGNTTAD